MVLEFTTFDSERLARSGVLAYVRVSSPDQAERRASLAEQRRKIKEHFEGRLGLTILEWYQDEGFSASKDHEAREQFWRMIERAKTDPNVGLIAVDDESRFFRDKYLTAKVKGELREHGVFVYTTTRTADPRTMAGLWQESIEETMAHADNIMRRDATMRGMRGNIRERDPETGWAFKNGGPAPYGWKNKRINLGHDSRGRPIARTIWELDPERAPIRRQILMWRLEGWSYDQIRDELNRRGVKPARRDVWSSTTIQTMCREDNIWIAAGYGIWNRHYVKGDRPPGVKFKPTDEWVIEPNAHPAIISEDDAKALIELSKNRRRTWKKTRGNHRRSDYLLSGLNAYEEPLFVCGRCGAPMVGNRIAVRGDGGSRRYICSTYNRHGRMYCEPVRVNADELETNVLRYIRERLLKEEHIVATIRAANTLIEEEHPKTSLVDQRRARIQEIERQIERAKQSILMGLDPEEWTDTIKMLRNEQKRLVELLEEDEIPELHPIPESAAPEIYRRLSEAFISGDVDQLRRVVRSYVLQIKLDPATGRVVARFAPTWLAGNDEPVSAEVVAPTGRVVGAMSEAIIVWSTQP